MSKKKYISSGYILKSRDGNKTYYKCCCSLEDLPILDSKENWRIYKINDITYYTNYRDTDFEFSIGLRRGN